MDELSGIEKFSSELFRIIYRIKGSDQIEPVALVLGNHIRGNFPNPSKRVRKLV